MVVENTRVQVLGQEVWVPAAEIPNSPLKTPSETIPLYLGW